MPCSKNCSKRIPVSSEFSFWNDLEDQQTRTHDKLRLFLIWLFHSDKISKKDADSNFSALSSESNLAESQKKVIMSLIDARTSKSDASNSGLLSRFALKSLNLVSQFLRGSSGAKIESIVSALLKNNLQIQGFTAVRLYEGDKTPVTEIDFKTVVVYCIDSGSYIEFDALSSLAKTSSSNVSPSRTLLSRPNLGRSSTAPETSNRPTKFWPIFWEVKSLKLPDHEQKWVKS